MKNTNEKKEIRKKKKFCDIWKKIKEEIKNVYRRRRRKKKRTSK